MNKYRICIFAEKNSSHVACFLEVAILLKSTLVSLGEDCDITINELAKDKLNILLGTNVLHGTNFINDYSYIIYQLEQLSESEGWYSENMHEMLLNADAVWDYSSKNMHFLKKHNIQAKLLPVGYHDVLKVIDHSKNKDLSTLFYGSINDRRRLILKQLQEREGKNAAILYGVYSKERNSIISRSKIIFNIHFYDAQIFECVRVSFLLNNRCFVISEESSDYPYKLVPLPLVPYDSLCDVCYYYIDHDDERLALADKMYENFRKHYQMTTLLSSVL